MAASNGPIDLTVRQVDWEDVFHDIVRVHLDHRPFAKAGAVVIVEHSGNTIRLVARGAPKNDRSAVWLDLRSREKLGLEPNTQAAITFKKASLRDEFMWAWSATDAMPRIASRLGLLSVGLGFLGVLLGALSVVLAICFAPAS